MSFAETLFSGKSRFAGSIVKSSKKTKRKLSKFAGGFSRTKSKSSGIEFRDLLRGTTLQMGMATLRSDYHSQNEDRACFEVLRPSKNSVFGEDEDQQLSELDVVRPVEPAVSLPDVRPPATNKEENISSAMEQGISGYAAVFDGHGGSKCSEYVSKVLGSHIKQYFCDEDAWLNGEEVLKDVFHKIDEDFCEIARHQREFSGACATVIVIKEEELIIGNIGDCRAVMVPLTETGSYAEPVEITVDHRADATAENIRINEAGGRVEQGRVFSLQPSRSFGDLDVKLAAGKDVVIASPDVDRVFVHTRTKVAKGKRNRAFMVVASDGVWDVLSNRQVAQAVQKALRKQGSKKSSSGEVKNDSKSSGLETQGSAPLPTMGEVSPDSIAKSIVRLSRGKGSDDDITVVVILF